MSGYYELTDNGTLTYWRWPEETNDILFPEQEIEIDGVAKLRGGAPVCCPIFGTMPETKDYEGVTLPQHGLVRLGNRHFHTLRKYPVGGGESVYFMFLDPWYHEVLVTVRLSEDGKLLEHEILVWKDPHSENYMPISIGFHPYFATHGDLFHITYGDYHITSDEIQNGDPFFITRREFGQKLLVELSYNNNLEISIDDGDYDHFCIWTDAKDKYICVEPVLGGGGKYNILRKGGEVRGNCKIRV